MPKRFTKPVVAVVILAIFLAGGYLVQSVRSPQSDITSGHSIVAFTDLEIDGLTGSAKVIDVQRSEQTTGGLFFGIAHANGAIDVGAQLELIDLTSPGPGETPPGGIASVVATYENLGPNALIDVFFRVNHSNPVSITSTGNDFGMVGVTNQNNLEALLFKGSNLSIDPL